VTDLHYSVCNNTVQMPSVWVENSRGPKKPFIRRWSISPMERGNFNEGDGLSIVKYRDTVRSSAKKTTEPIEMPFGMWARVVEGTMY